ncbi:UDP-3-O-(3-hydroxymyristoyl)glucosamine N-acyltransferase [Campylobacter corcagiensis]|uniref:UDP-3-O-acylglucosamine N-acyltransferase n=1 Tax=Campylobacter corcagiensis TaxID=1448857 RepID=A0A7M1LFT0_9BACT|nr:UDP-3-O-(3-hydroxymyristoyl)glucosamine N-acyltransferase [Campylobacter corcagiensis]QKF64673.1 UDP-3-O-(R-3-hydroxymyristoyl)-glucosamine N-acyltransferase [Campylobacter corcagiensis]QOQ87161.1 UDP-3-O-(3-hydroxymyristoyl)glucosamine N-acyltransferase [Campylobacter corcagiensis]
MKISEICKILGAKFSGDDMDITGLNSLDIAGDGELSYCDSPKNAKFLKNTKASAVLVNSALTSDVPNGVKAVAYDNPHLGFAILSKYFAKELLRDNKPALISDFAKVMSGAYVGSNSKVGNGTLIMPGVFIGDNVEIGQNCTIHPNAVIYNDTKIGDRVEIHANAVIGSDGFGYAHTKDGRHIKIYHNGNVIIEDDVEIGACTTIDRSVFKSTIIKKGTKIDNLVQIGHNCELGENCIVVSQTGISGSTILGRNVVMGGQSGTAGHLVIGDFAQCAARAGVSKSLDGNKNYAGHPIVELKEWLRLNAKINRFFKDN